MKYQVTFEEKQLVRITVDANSMDEANNKAIKKLKEGFGVEVPNTSQCTLKDTKELNLRRVA